MSATRHKQLGISMGDPAGVGPEIIARCANAWPEPEHAFIIYGSETILRKAFQSYAQFQPDLVNHDHKASLPGWYIKVCSDLEFEDLQQAQVTKESGQAALDAINRLCDDCISKKVDAMVTAPVSKEAIDLTGASFDGHTGWIAHRCGVQDEMMLMHSEDLNVAYATTHIALKDLNKHLTQERIVQCLKHCANFVKNTQNQSLPIAVCGLNPHAGENGLFGDEEAKIIRPAIEAAQSIGIEASGPHPADTLFVESIRKQFSAILALYHDQGGIPFKMLAFDTGVNLTMGLPIVRTSVDHGTAWDIAWQGRAQHESLHSAICVALQLIA